MLLSLNMTAQSYHPSGRAFVTTNGSNRYTRALYGSPTDWRIETSDRPVFAIYKKRDYRNIRFRINGVALDSVGHCVARYEAGMRSYEVTHPAWGRSAQLTMKVVAGLDDEHAIWRIRTSGFEGDVNVEVVVSGIKNTKLQRNGDLGVDAADAFEADGKQPLQQLNRKMGNGVCYVGASKQTLSLLTEEEGRALFDTDESAMQQLSGRIEFNTPDPFINTLGGALTIAAEGDWDGETWLHGCIGWRMPLAGWRAGYLGDVLGWPDRAVKHFDAYANSQVRDVEPELPHPTQDPAQQMARSEKKWHTQMYSNGYICRNPNRNDQMHHYDMNLNYMDELLWHFQYDADQEYMRKMWPVIKSHLAWEKRNFDPDGDHLYDAYCCIWASDALYYSGGAVTHSSAYNYRGHRLAARIAQLIGEDPTPYQQEADAILKAMNSRLWLEDKGHWAEYQDLLGLKRVHESAAVWSIYTPIDCEACTPQQAYRATQYIDREIPHIPVTEDADTGEQLSIIASSNWLPYSWSINNVAAAEVMHTALAYFEAGREEEGFRLMKANIIDQMYDGRSPGNFGQVSKHDAARGECYRDFGDCIGISARTLLQGLFGIRPQALFGQCVIQPGFPSTWESASVKTPYMDYRFQRSGDELIYDITQRFAQPLTIVIRISLGNGEWKEIEGNDQAHQVIRIPIPQRNKEQEQIGDNDKITVAGNGGLAGINNHHREFTSGGPFRKIPLDRWFNANVTDVYEQEYLSPRPPYTTLQIPLQGVGDWCHPAYRPTINDSVFRSKAVNNEFVAAGIPFHTPVRGRNIVYTSLWDNYPDSVSIPIGQSASQAWLLMAGTTNHMQCHITNGLVVADYQDGTRDTLQLINPDNWCPIERDYFIDGRAFRAPDPRPYRIALASGIVSRKLSDELHIPFNNALGGEIGPKGADGGEIPGGAATMLSMPLNPQKRVRSITIRTLSNDVVIGLMSVTLQ